MVLERALCVLAVLAMAAPAGAAWGPTYRSGDVAELRRAAMNGGAAAVRQRLRSRDRGTVLGAIVAAEAAGDAWELLDDLAVLASGWDRATAAPAAHAAARIARTIDGERMIRLDVPDDRIADAAAAWRTLAERGDRWSDVRVHALEVAARLDGARVATAETAPDVAADLLVLAADPDPEVRRAALELVPIPAAASAWPALVARVVDDRVPAVQLAAAQTLCAGLPHDAAAVLAALGPAGLEAMRVAARSSGSGAAAVAVARCLAADPDPRSQRALLQLRHTAPPTVRGAIARVAATIDPARPASAP